MIVFGALLLALPPPAFECRHKVSQGITNLSDRPLDDGYEVISFYESPSMDDDEFRYCKIAVVGNDGISQEIKLKAKKALVADSVVKCSIKGLLW